MGLGKTNNLKVNPGAESSRFVIDLKEDFTTAEAKAIKNNKNLIVESKLEKLAELDYKKYFGESKIKTKVWLKENFVKLGVEMKSWQGVTASSRQTSPSSKKRRQALTALSSHNKKWLIINQLAFTVLAKLVFLILKKVVILIYKIGYWVGWTIVFCLRLVYFLSLAIIKPIIRPMASIIIQFQPLIAKSFNFLLSGYGSARSAALTMGLKRKNWLKREVASNKISYENVSRRPIGYLRPVLVFAGILLIMILPVKAYTYYKTIDSAKGKVLGASEQAVNNLISGGQAAANLDFNQAGESFTKASNNFLIAENQLKEINSLLFTLGSIVPLKNIQLAAAGKNIVRAGELRAAAGKNLSLAVNSLFNYQASGPSAILENLSVYGHQAIKNLTDLNNELDKIDSQVIPPIYQSEFILLKQKTGKISQGLSEFISLADKLEIFLGQNSLKRYLLIFQNNAEIRASGGFIGSFTLMDFSNGQIKKIETPGGGSYDTDSGLLKKIKSPEPLRLIRPDWHFWDANWWPDWPTSARKLAWFYENSDGSTVDGVIGLTPTVMEKLLSLIGPIDLSDQYGVIISADNFWQVTQEFAEQKPDVTKEPKKIIGDLLDKIIEELPRRLTKNNLVPLLKVVEEMLSDKNILFYFTDTELQAEADALGWTGRIKPTTGDYLSVINTNIAGGKSDRKITQEINLETEIMPDGTIVDNLTIRRTHEAINREPFSGVRNVNWLRVYVPLGSKLIEAAGFKPVDKIFFKVAEEDWLNDPDLARGEALALTDETSGTKIYEELGKTVFANWSQLDPGETIEIKIKYQLPFKITDKKSNLTQGLLDQLIAKANEVINPEQKNLYSYSIILQKQPGMNSSSVTSELKISDNFKPIWRFPGDLTLSQNGWLVTENFDLDKLLGVMVEER